MYFLKFLLKTLLLNTALHKTLFNINFLLEWIFQFQILEKNSFCFSALWLVFNLFTCLFVCFFVCFCWASSKEISFTKTCRSGRAALLCIYVLVGKYLTLPGLGLFENLSAGGLAGPRWKNMLYLRKLFSIHEIL